MDPDWIDAIASAVAALVTIPLWIVSWRAADAAKRSANLADKSARAAIGVELPFLSASPGDLLRTQGPPPLDGGYAGVVIHDIPDQHSVLTDLDLKNNGRTPAILTLLQVGHAVSEALPEQPAFLRDYDFDQDDVIPPTRHHHVDLAYHIELTDEQKTALTDAAQFLWLYVRVKYLDFLDESREAGFCWKYSQLHGVGAYAFLPIPNAPTTYRYRR